jgi:hypothetical protein
MRVRITIERVTRESATIEMVVADEKQDVEEMYDAAETVANTYLSWKQVEQYRTALGTTHKIVGKEVWSTSVPVLEKSGGIEWPDNEELEIL